VGKKNRENRGNGMESGFGKSSHLELLHLDIGETIEEAGGNGMEYVSFTFYYKSLVIESF
jgi:hypothetical protein